jgi:hypothetical protein
MPAQQTLPLVMELSLVSLMDNVWQKLYKIEKFPDDDGISSTIINQ